MNKNKTKKVIDNIKFILKDVVKPLINITISILTKVNK